MELDEHAYIGENGYNRIVNSLKLHIRGLDAQMSYGDGMPEQWVNILTFEDVRDIH